MSARKPAAAGTANWYVEAGHGRRFGHPFHASRTIDERRANSLALIITTSLLFVLSASAVMVGGRAVITPLLRPPPPVADTRNRGDIVFTMPDGEFCQHMSFDNATGRMRSGGMQHCVDDGGDSGEPLTRFKWGAAR